MILFCEKNFVLTVLPAHVIEFQTTMIQKLNVHSIYISFCQDTKDCVACVLSPLLFPLPSAKTMTISPMQTDVIAVKQTVFSMWNSIVQHA